MPLLPPGYCALAVTCSLPSDIHRGRVYSVWRFCSMLDGTLSWKWCVSAVCRRSAGRVQSPSLTDDAGAYTQGGRVWQRITVYVLGRLDGAYGIVQMLGSRGLGIVLLFHSIVGYRH